MTYDLVWFSISLFQCGKACDNLYSLSDLWRKIPFFNFTRVVFKLFVFSRENQRVANSWRITSSKLRDADWSSWIRPDGNSRRTFLGFHVSAYSIRRYPVDLVVPHLYLGNLAGRNRCISRVYGKRCRCDALRLKSDPNTVKRSLSPPEF